MRTNDIPHSNEDRSPEERHLRFAMGRRIRQLRKLRQWSLADLAQRIAVPCTTLKRWERGALPPVGRLILLSEALGTTLDVLLAGRQSTEGPDLTSDQRKAAALHLNELAGLLGLRARK